MRKDGLEGRQECSSSVGKTTVQTWISQNWQQLFYWRGEAGARGGRQKPGRVRCWVEK